MIDISSNGKEEYSSIGEEVLEKARDSFSSIKSKVEAEELSKEAADKELGELLNFVSTSGSKTAFLFITESLNFHEKTLISLRDLYRVITSFRASLKI